MPTLVHLLPTEIDVDNLDEFRDVVFTLVERHRALILDCSQLEHISVPGMRVLESAARNGTVTLVRATPIVHLLASVFGLDVDDDDTRWYDGGQRQPQAAHADPRALRLVHGGFPDVR